MASLSTGIRFASPTAAVAAAASDSIIQSIDASGWTITAKTTPPAMQPDSAPRSLYVNRAGFDASGNAVSFVDRLVLTARLRQPAPNDGTLTATQIVLSDYVYASDSAVGIPNNSTEASPKPIANWALADRQTVGDTIQQAVVAAHRDGRSGRPVACVVFRATDGTTTVTQTVSAPTILGHSGDKCPVIGYACALDVSSLAAGQITLNARVYPVVGSSASVLDSADGIAEREFSPRIYTRSAASPLYIYVAAGGNDATALLSSNAATAKASPAATLAGAFIRARAQNGTVMDNVVIRLGTGTWELTANNASGSYSTAAECIIERDPDVAFGSVTYRFGGNFDTRLLYARWRNLQLARTAGAIGLKTARVVIENCSLDNNGVSAQLNADRLYVLGLAVTNGAASLFAPGAGEMILLRGISGSAFSLEDRCLLGCAVTAGAPAGSSTRGQNGCFVGFNRFMGVGSSQPFWQIGVSADVTGYANIQNLIEWTSASNNAAIRNSGDSATGNIAHYVDWHTTVVGFDILGRHNFLYNETAAALRTHKLCAVVGPIWTQLNTKHDRFAQNTALPNPSARIGGWPFMLGVGCRGILTMFAANAPVEAQEYPGPDASIGTSHALGNDPLFNDPRAVTSGPAAGAGGGDYGLRAGSPAIGRVKASPLPFDLAGAVRNSAASASGAFERLAG